LIGHDEIVRGKSEVEAIFAVVADTYRKLRRV
jgi:hypothetical protein